jgi:hypothetical protein
MILDRFLAGSPVKLLNYRVGLLRPPTTRLCPDCDSAMECHMITFVESSREPWNLPLPVCFTCVPAREAAEPVEIAIDNTNLGAELQRGLFFVWKHKRLQNQEKTA